MAKVLKYRKMSQYRGYINELIEAKSCFTLSKTTYSRKITTDDKVIIFNQNGKGDFKCLKLINSVRNDAKNYLAMSYKDRYKDIQFYNLFNHPLSDHIISKIDIKSAYWNYALKSNIISEETNELFMKLYEGYSYDFAKKARLKALGSLATVKKIIPYEDGRPNNDKVQIKMEPTRDLYLAICSGIDELMKNCQSNIKECIYYYWDCMFVPKSFESHTVEYFNDMGYDVSIGETKLKVINIRNVRYLVSIKDERPDKVYMTRRNEKAYQLQER